MFHTGQITKTASYDRCHFSGYKRRKEKCAQLSSRKKATRKSCNFRTGPFACFAGAAADGREPLGRPNNRRIGRSLHLAHAWSMIELCRLLKNAFVAFLNLAMCGAKLRTAREITTLRRLFRHRIRARTQPVECFNSLPRRAGFPAEVFGLEWPDVTLAISDWSNCRPAAGGPAARIARMQSSMRTLFRGAAFFAATSVVGTIGYALAGWDPLDAAYMTVITIFGVGYGEVHPLDNDPRLRFFTMFVIVAGCSSVIYFIGGFVQMIAEGEFNRVLGARRMTKGIEQLKNHAIMCGYGRVGQALARELKASGQPFVIVDSDTERLREAEDEGYLVLVGDCTDEHVLLMAGIDRARVVASVLSSDAANVFLTLTARELNGEVEIIARAEAPETEKKLFRSGANRVVLPTAIGATKIANLISRPTAESLLGDNSGREHLNEELEHFGLKMQEFPVNAGSELVGRPISDAEVRGQGGVVIVAVRQADRTMVRRPEGKFVLSAGDSIIVLGHSEHVISIARRAATDRTVLFRGAKT